VPGSKENTISLNANEDAELFRLEGIVRWLDAAEARLQQRRTAEDEETVHHPAVEMEAQR
jgi:hypothetical protein